ncbi:MAG: hypothetical protein PUE17_05025 [Bacteroidales bacterium]|nr:hypothetical protein [Bacteroidales bacterium]
MQAENIDNFVASQSSFSQGQAPLRQFTVPKMAERRVKILRPGLENPEAGLEKPKPGLGTTKVGAEKKEGSFGYGSLPLAIANLSIRMRNSKFAFPELTF